jgi:hypothetical protein
VWRPEAKPDKRFLFRGLQNRPWPLPVFYASAGD